MQMALGLKRWMVVLAVMLVGLPLAWAQPADNQGMVHVIGTSRIQGGDMSAAREAAIEDALGAAVNQVLNDLLSPEHMAGNFQVLHESILARKDQFVRDYKVLAQSQLGATYRLMVQANISVARLNEAIKSAGLLMDGGSVPIRLIVQGIGGRIAEFVKLRSALTTLSGVDDLQVQEMMPSEAVLSVRYQGNARTLVDALRLIDFDTFGIDIASVVGDEIRLQLVPR